MTLLQNFDIDPEEEKQRIMEEKLEMIEAEQMMMARQAPPPDPMADMMPQGPVDDMGPVEGGVPSGI